MTTKMIVASYLPTHSPKARREWTPASRFHTALIEDEIRERLITAMLHSFLPSFPACRLRRRAWTSTRSRFWLTLIKGVAPLCFLPRCRSRSRRYISSSGGPGIIGRSVPIKLPATNPSILFKPWLCGLKACYTLAESLRAVGDLPRKAIGGTCLLGLRVEGGVNKPFSFLASCARGRGVWDVS